MSDLYSLTQLIKVHPFYKIHTDSILLRFRSLGLQGLLTAQNVLTDFENYFPLLAKDLKDNLSFSEVKDRNAALSAAGVQFVCYGEELYPSSCYRMMDPPLSFCYVGQPAWKNPRSLAVVGSRDAREESLAWMEQALGAFCEQASCCIVSGAARGVDQKAHSIALRKRQTTIAVLPSGLGDIYPSSFYDWIEEITEQGGCLVSEYEHRQKMHKHLFHHRNRLIAALGQGTLLVEAKRRSGTLITAQQTIQLGRPLWVVPGHPLDANFHGSLDLLTEGAIIIRDAEDLLMFFNSEFASEQMHPAGMDGAETHKHYL